MADFFCDSGILLLLPLGTAIFLLASLARETTKASGVKDGREALLLSATCIVGWASAGVVLLSLSCVLTPVAMMGWWSLGFVLSCLYWMRVGKPTVYNLLKKTRLSFYRVFLVDGVALGMIALIFVGSFLMGFFSPPNNGDVLIYHLPRQLFWMGAGTVFPESMPYAHMEKMPPLTEWLGVNLYLLAGTDRWHFLVQWVSQGACCVLISLLVKAGGGSRSAQIFAVLFFATLPAAFLESSNSKNDIFLTATLLGCCWIGEKIFVQRALDWQFAVLAGAWAGFAMLAKGTGLAFLPIIACIYGVRFLAVRGRIQIVRLFLAVVLAGGIAAFHYLPQAQSIIAAETKEASDHANAKFSLPVGASVLVRNISLQFSLPWEVWNQSLENGVKTLSAALDVDVNDATSTFAGTQFAIRYEPTYEDNATGFFHFFLAFVLVCGGFLFLPRSSLRSSALTSALLFLLSLCLFSFLFRWQPWHSRLLIPVVAFAAPGIGLLVTAWAGVWIRVLVLGVLLGWLAPSLLAWSRPLVGKATVFTMSDSALVGRAGSGSIFLPSLGQTIREMAPKGVFLDINNAPVHAALRYFPRSTQLFFPSKLPQDVVPEIVVTNLEDARLAPATQELIKDKELLFSMEKWRLWAAPDLVQKLKQSEAIPPIFRVTVRSGLGALQGPYPEYGMPIFANVMKNGAEIEISPLNAPANLHLKIARFEGPCVVKVLIDEQSAGEMQLEGTTESASLDVRIPANPKPTVIRLVPDRSYASAYDPAPISFRLQLLQLFTLN